MNNVYDGRQHEMIAMTPSWQMMLVTVIKAAERAFASRNSHWQIADNGVAHEVWPSYFNDLSDVKGNCISWSVSNIKESVWVTSSRH